MGLLRSSSSSQSRCNGKVHTLQEKTGSEDEARGITGNHQACARKGGQHSPAAFGNHMRRVLQRRAITHERSNSRMLLKLVEQFIGPQLVLQSRFLREERIRTIGGDDDWSIEVAILAATTYTGDPFIFIKQIINNGRANQ